MRSCSGRPPTRRRGRGGRDLCGLRRNQDAEFVDKNLTKHTPAPERATLPGHVDLGVLGKQPADEGGQVAPAVSMKWVALAPQPTQRQRCEPDLVFPLRFMGDPQDGHVILFTATGGADE